VKSIPNVGLPAAVETFDGGLKAGFTWGHKDRDDGKTEAETDDTSDAVGMLLRPEKAVVVVELGIAGQAELAPVIDQQEHDVFGEHFAGRPGLHQTAVERDGGQDIEMRTALDGQPLDDVDAVQFGNPVGDLRDVPAWRRGRPADPTTAVESAASQPITESLGKFLVGSLAGATFGALFWIPGLIATLAFFACECSTPDFPSRAECVGSSWGVESDQTNRHDPSDALPHAGPSAEPWKARREIAWLRFATRHRGEPQTRFRADAR